MSQLQSLCSRAREPQHGAPWPDSLGSAPGEAAEMRSLLPAAREQAPLTAPREESSVQRRPAQPKINTFLFNYNPTITSLWCCLSCLHMCLPNCFLELFSYSSINCFSHFSFTRYKSPGDHLIFISRCNRAGPSGLFPGQTSPTLPTMSSACLLSAEKF